jgi:hypothetical protein
MRKQGTKSMGNYTDPHDGVTRFGCVYRGANGCKCAVGCLIPDDKYSPDLEGHGVATTTIREVLGDYLEHGNMLVSLQRIHDNYQPNMWEEQFLVLANHYSLTYTPKEEHVPVQTN